MNTARLPSEQTERRALSTMWLVFCPDKGLITTEPYDYKAYERVAQLQAAGAGPCFVVEATKIEQCIKNTAARRVYKIERDRLHITQEMLK